MIKAVLFDLDGTLLDIDLERFLRDYFAALGPAITRIVPDRSPSDIVAAVVAGTEAMAAVHPKWTNEQAFNDRFTELTGADLANPEARIAIAAFYASEFPALRADARPHEGASRVLGATRECGCLLALATNPIFPIEAIRERARWAGVDADAFDLVTSYEVMHATKPHAAYFTEIAAALGVSPAECLMVGDDPLLDLPAAEIGMSTWYVGEGHDVRADRSGNLTELALSLPALTSGAAGA